MDQLVQVLRTRRLASVAVAVLVLGGLGCQDPLSDSSSADWGFVSLTAKQGANGHAIMVPSGVFFRGSVAAIPDASQQPDTCFPPVAYFPASNVISGVRYLDAGSEITLQFPSQTITAPRQNGTGITLYELDGVQTYPWYGGDSVQVTVPGATGGYGAGVVRAKMAEAFTMQTLVHEQGNPLQVQWTTPAVNDGNSAMIVSLIYAPPGAPDAVREVRCVFRDDGSHTIPNSVAATWSDASNPVQYYTATRLRTRFVGGGSALRLMVISSYSQPFPPL